MQILNSKLIAKRFSKNEISSKEKVTYLLSFLLLWSVLDALPIFFPGKINNHDHSYLWWLLNTVSILAGVVWCYQKNKKVDDHEFLDRLIAFGFINTVWVCIFSPICIALASGAVFASVVIGKKLNLNGIETTLGLDFFDFLFIFPMLFLWFILIRRDIGKIRSENS